MANRGTTWSDQRRPDTNATFSARPMVNPDSNVNYSGGQNATMVQNPRRRMAPEVTSGPAPAAGVKADPSVGPVVTSFAPPSAAPKAKPRMKTF